MKSAYYNEFEPFAADWLESLVDAEQIHGGHVARRSIKDVTGSDVDGFRRVHLFAGIGGWERALQLAGWGEREVWTASCPCQPFSAAGKQNGEDDPRHLWPDAKRLIEACQPSIVFGEQVASKLGREWLAGVRSEMEVLGYDFGAADLGAACIGAPHIRQRLFWVAYRNGDGFSIEQKQDGESERSELESPRRTHAVGCGDTKRLSNAELQHTGARVERVERIGRVSDSEGNHKRTGERRPGEAMQDRRCDSNIARYWSHYTIATCRDTDKNGNQKRRRVPVPESGIQPLAYGLPRNVGSMLAGLSGVDKDSIKAARKNRVGRLKGYGNAIVPEVAAVFIRSVMEVVFAD